MSENSTSLYISNYSAIEENVLGVILCIIIILSLFGNGGMLFIFYQNDKLWNSTNILIVNLSFSGILVTLFCMPFSLITVIQGSWPFEEGPLCQINAFASSQLLLVTILTHTLISVDKYFAVVKPFSRSMTVPRTSKLIFAAWVIAAIMTLLPLFGIGKYAYNHTTLVCGVGFPDSKRITDSIYLFTLATVGFILPNMIMGYTYIQVFLAVQNHTRRLKESAVTSFDVLKLQKRLIRTVILSLVCFLICWSPFCILCIMAVFIKSANDFPYGLGVAAYWCGYSYSALNPFIICTMSQRFHDGLIRITIYFLQIPVKCYYLILTKFKKRKDTVEIAEKSLVETNKSSSFLNIPCCPSNRCIANASPSGSITSSFISLNSGIYYVENTSL